DAEVVLPAGDASSRCRLMVLDARGNPCANQTLVGPRDGKLVTRVTLAPGSYRAEAKSDSGASGSVAFTLAPGDSPPALRIMLRCRAASGPATCGSGASRTGRFP